MFKIEWTKRALGEIDKLDQSISRRIIKKVDELENNPFSKDIKRLKREKAFRLRVGDYRVIFDIEKKRVIVLKVGHRKNIYY